MSGPRRPDPLPEPLASDGQLQQARDGWRLPAHRGAFDKGARAFLQGAPVSACPYRDVRRDDGRLTGSRGFLHAWREGWRAAERAARTEKGSGCRPSLSEQPVHPPIAAETAPVAVPSQGGAA